MTSCEHKLMFSETYLSEIIYEVRNMDDDKAMIEREYVSDDHVETLHQKVFCGKCKKTILMGHSLKFGIAPE